MAESTHPGFPLGKISRTKQMLPASVQGDIDALVHTAEFCGLDSLEEQLLSSMNFENFLRQHPTGYSRDHLLLVCNESWLDGLKRPYP